MKKSLALMLAAGFAMTGCVVDEYEPSDMDLVIETYSWGVTGADEAPVGTKQDDVRHENLTLGEEFPVAWTTATVTKVRRNGVEIEFEDALAPSSEAGIELNTEVTSITLARGEAKELATRSHDAGEIVTLRLE